MAYGEFFEGSYKAEFLCQNCKEAIAFIQFPMTKEVKKWEEENPVKKQDGKIKIKR
jgi:hypothetical protein